MSIKELDLIKKYCKDIKKEVENKSTAIFIIQIIYLLIIGINNLFVHYKLTCLYPLDFILCLLSLMNYKIYDYNEEYTWVKFCAKIIRKIYYFRVSSIVVQRFNSNNYETIASFLASLVALAIVIELLKMLTKGKVTFFVVYIMYGVVFLINKKDFLDVFLGTSGIYILIEWITSEDFVDFCKKILPPQSFQILNKKIKDKASILKATSLFIIFSSIVTGLIKNILTNEIKEWILEVVKYGFKLFPFSVEISSIHDDSIIGFIMVLTIIVISSLVQFSVFLWINSKLPAENRITYREYLSEFIKW